LHEKVVSLVLVYGSRPEAIKLGPLAAELRARDVPFRVLCTGQHTTLLRGTPAETDLADAIQLGIASDGDVDRWIQTALPKVHLALRELGATHVVVQGDTMSALVGAIAAKRVQATLCHVEAGVRSGHRGDPWPEERFRCHITRLADWHFAPTPRAVWNLRQEGKTQRVVLTGNTSVSALARYSDAKPEPPEAYLLMTMHRREWLREVQMHKFIGALAEALTKHPRLTLTWPVHPAVYIPWHFNPQITMFAPFPYRDMTEALARACGVLTDSGGLVEEAATLGVPCAILRRHNDRPEAVEAGVARCFDPTPEGVRRAVDCLVGGELPRRPSDIYGTPDAAARIARYLEELTSEAKSTKASVLA